MITNRNRRQPQQSTQSVNLALVPPEDLARKEDETHDQWLARVRKVSQEKEQELADAQPTKPGDAFIVIFAQLVEIKGESEGQQRQRVEDIRRTVLALDGVGAAAISYDTPTSHNEKAAFGRHVMQRALDFLKTGWN